MELNSGKVIRLNQIISIDDEALPILAVHFESLSILEDKTLTPSSIITNRCFL